MNKYILETERCYVREMDETDVADEIELYDNSPHMVDFIEPLYSFEEEVRYHKLYVEKIYGKYGYGMWGVYDKETHRLIGEAGLEHRIDINREKFPYEWMFDDKCSELGFCFAEDLWNRGYCTEVCRAILDYGKNTLGHNRFFARAEKENGASVRVLEKLGFKHYEGRYYIMDV
ncbi:MAG: GNAT family N-acetyltransferase [Lachnospiraceae bacterium]|nr:GNAT family N-acetyltransferase [Lachnospiraceae bacterium]